MENWIILSLVALVVLGITNFLAAYLLKSMSPYVLLAIVFGTEFAIAIALLLKSGVALSLTPRLWALSITTGALFAIGIAIVYFSLATGLASRIIPIINMNTLVVVLLAVFVLNEQLTPRVGAGIVLATISLYLLTT